MSIFSLATLPKPRERPLPQLHYLDVWEDRPGRLKSRNGILPYDHIQQWFSLYKDYEIEVHENKKLEESDLILRIVSCDSGVNSFTVGCGEAAFNQISKFFQLHVNTEEIITNNNGAYARYFTQSLGSKDIDAFSLIYKVANTANVGYDSISLRHNLQTGTTRAFLHGLLDSESRHLIDFLLPHITKGVFEQPLLLPSQLLSSHRRKTESYRFEVDESLHKTEIEIGYAIPGILKNDFQAQARGIGGTEEGSVDLESVTRRLHAVSTELGAVSHASKTGREIGSFLLETGRELKEHLIKHVDAEVLVRARGMEQKLEYEANMYRMIESQAAVLRDRVQNHINLTFSLIAQDDNRINRSIAEESALIALASKRDSTAMKTIALLTVIFLPPTFVATFFAMPMFNSPQSDDSPKSITQSYWLYWVVAVPLTVLVMVVWRIWLAFEYMKYNEGVRMAKNRKWQNPSLILNAKKMPGMRGKLMAKYSEYQERARRDREGRGTATTLSTNVSRHSSEVSEVRSVQAQQYVVDYRYDSS